LIPAPETRKPFRQAGTAYLDEKVFYQISDAISVDLSKSYIPQYENIISLP